jgi:hypothetical protein
MSLILEPLSDAQLVLGGSEETGLFFGVLMTLTTCKSLHIVYQELGIAELTS